MTTKKFEPRDRSYESRVRASFARQRAMHTIGARLVRVEPGEVELDLPFREDLTQQHGFLHAGIVTALVDSACGYAALSLMDRESAVLSVEYKVNLLAPAVGERMRAIGRVIKPGRTLARLHGRGDRGGRWRGVRRDRDAGDDDGCPRATRAR